MYADCPTERVVEKQVEAGECKPSRVGGLRPRILWDKKLGNRVLMVYIYIYLFIPTYTYTYTYIYIYIHTNIFMYIQIHIHIYIYIYLYF